MYPFKFRPLLKQTLWGGERIVPFKGIASGPGRVGESWELSGVAGSESVVAEGPLAGVCLPELVGRYRGALVGEANYARFGREFPLLVKFIDARQDLSIQVHPDDRLAAERHGGRGKTEMWYVVDAEPGARLRAGFSRSVTPAEYEAHVAGHTITDVLREYEIRPGDLFFLPAGRIHSIGAGAFIAEIQQTSDITYRIYDFGRTDADGRMRELHTGLAKDAIDYRVLDDYRTHYEPCRDRSVELVRCAHFTTSLYDLTAVHTCDFSALDSFVAMVFVAGAGRITDDCGHTVAVRRGETVLIPAAVRRVVAEPGPEGLRFLTSHIG